MANVRIFDVVAQMLTESSVEARQQHVLTPGQMHELARGECGTVKAVQIAADYQTLYLQCDNAMVAFRLPDALAVAALRALMTATMTLPDDEIRALDTSRFQLGPDGRPSRIATEDRG